MTEPARRRGTAPKKESKPTDYVVLRKLPALTSVVGGPEEVGPDRYEFVTAITAKGENQAKRQAFATLAEGRDGEVTETLVACPARSFQPEKIRVVNQPRIVFGD